MSDAPTGTPSAEASPTPSATPIPSASASPQAPKSAAPTADQLAAATSKNSANVKATPDEGSVSIVAGGTAVLIGGGHLPATTDYVQSQTDLEEGELWVNKGGVFSKGSIEVEGIAAKQGAVKSAIGAFSDKRVTFI